MAGLGLRQPALTPPVEDPERDEMENDPFAADNSSNSDANEAGKRSSRVCLINHIFTHY